MQHVDTTFETKLISAKRLIVQATDDTMVLQSKELLSLATTFSIVADTPKARLDLTTTNDKNGIVRIDTLGPNGFFQLNSDPGTSQVTVGHDEINIQFGAKNIGSKIRMDSTKLNLQFGPEMLGCLLSMDGESILLQAGSNKLEVSSTAGINATVGGNSWKITPLEIRQVVGINEVAVDQFGVNVTSAETSLQVNPTGVKENAALHEAKVEASGALDYLISSCKHVMNTVSGLFTFK